MFWAFVITSFLSIDKENTALVKIFGYTSIRCARSSHMAAASSRAVPCRSS